MRIKYDLNGEETRFGKDSLYRHDDSEVSNKEIKVMLVEP